MFNSKRIVFNQGLNDSHIKAEHCLKGLVAAANEALKILASSKTPLTYKLEGRLKEIQEALGNASRYQDKLDLLSEIEKDQ